ncbi:MAG: hypothetical protein EB111_05475 [Actinobacteria bacterium]|nr:hypothetical protein [Actinomycetota bacterium]
MTPKGDDMFSKKARVLIATGVLTALGVAVTGVASARINRVESTSTVAAAPAHDKGGGGHLDAAATALGMTESALRDALVPGTSLADIAATKGVAVKKVIDAIVAAETTELKERVADGDLTQARADAILANLSARVTTLVNSDVPAMGRGFGRDGGRGFGKGDDHGPGDGDDHGPRGHGLPGLRDSTVLEDTLGMTREEIRAGLESGKSIADLAKEKGVSIQKVVDALVAEARVRITDMVNGKLPTGDQHEDE